mmetsp:Transcript_4141/g.4812  ORF Transcript_4141/g.4812 Transcript_4141/m.4812 type:complete len:286 (+) Transcript_4141:207-1064(+)
MLPPLFPFIIDDAPELLSDQTGPSDQAAIDLWLRHELVDGIGCHRTSVLDANGLGHLLVIKTRQDRAEELVDLVGILGSANQSSADRPNWLIGNHDVAHLLLGHPKKILGKLHFKSGIFDVQIKFFLSLSNAKNGLQFILEHFQNLLVDGIIIVAEERSPLAVSAQDVLASDALEHAAGDFSGVRSLLFPEHRLGSDGHPGLLDGISDLADEGMRGENHHFGTHFEVLVNGAGLIPQESGQSSSKLSGLILRQGIHLPVAGHDRLALCLEGRRGRGKDDLGCHGW